MINCPFCQTANDEKGKFCSNCGGLLVNKPNEEAAFADMPQKIENPISSVEDEWQSVDQPGFAQGNQMPYQAVPPTQPAPGAPVQGHDFQPAPQGQPPYTPPPAYPPSYPPAPQSPKKNNKGLLIGLLVGGVLLLAACVILIMVITRSVKKKVTEGLNNLEWVIEGIETETGDAIGTMQAPMPTEIDSDDSGDVQSPDDSNNAQQPPANVAGFTPIFFDALGSDSPFESFVGDSSQGQLTSDGFAITVTEKNSLGWQTSGRVNELNMVVQVDAERISADPINSYGLICRFVDNDNYVQGDVSFDNWITIRKYLNGKEVRLVDRRVAGISDDKNTVTLACVDDVVTLFVNGLQVAAIKDFSPMSGDVGISTGNFTDGSSTVAFTNLQAFKVDAGKLLRTSADLPMAPTYKSNLAYENAGYSYQNNLQSEAEASKLRFVDKENYTIAWQDGHFTMTMKDTDRYLTANTNEVNYMDMVVSVDVLDFDHDAMVGVVCRHQSVDSFYALAVAKDGWTGIYKVLYGEYTELYGQTHNNVLPDGENTISASCIGSNLTLLVNGNPVASVVDDDLISGDGAVLIQSFKQAPVSVQYKNFIIEPARQIRLRYIN